MTPRITVTSRLRNLVLPARPDPARSRRISEVRLVVSAMVVLMIFTAIAARVVLLSTQEANARTAGLSVPGAEREISVLEAEWAHLSRPERVLDLSKRLLEMQPIPEDRVLPIDAIPMRILPNFDEPVADVGVITLLPPEDEAPPRGMTRIAADAGEDLATITRVTEEARQ